MSFVEVIARKRDGQPLDREEIESFVQGAAAGSLPPEQLAALLMAICCRGMDERETHWLTEAMLASGERWELARLRPDAVDKHSTGGVGDTVSLILAPLLAAVGVPVAMMAGRGLGHSQGTLDKLDAIPGVRCDRDRDGLLSLLDECGAAIVAQTATIAPADRVLYALRDVTGTVPSLPLIVGSIMSKKLALGAATLVLDVKAGSGAFRKTAAAATELAAALRAVGIAAGIATEALVTDMSQPLGPALGTACEVRETLAILEGSGDHRLRELTVRLCEEALLLRGVSRQESRARLERALADGSARAAWDRMVVAHGGDPDPDRLATPRETVAVLADRDGVLAAVDGEALGWLAVAVGAGRRVRDDALDHRAGLLVHARIGDRVERGQPLASVLLGDREVERDRVVRQVAAAFVLADVAHAPPLVLGSVNQLVGGGSADGGAAKEVG